MANQSRSAKPRKLSAQTAFSIRTGKPFHRWLTEFAVNQRSSVPTLLDKAVAEFANNHGYSPPPPRNARD